MECCHPGTTMRDRPTRMDRPVKAHRLLLHGASVFLIHDRKNGTPLQGLGMYGWPVATNRCSLREPMRLPGSL